MGLSAEELSDRILANPAMKEIDIQRGTYSHEMRLAKVLGGVEIYLFLVEALAMVSLQRGDSTHTALASALVIGFPLGRTESAEVALMDFTAEDAEPPSGKEGP